MSRKNQAKSYWEMTTDELREATREFDEEFVADKARPLTPEMQSRWRRAKAKSSRDPAPPMTSLERIIGRELDADELEGLDQMTNGKKDNVDLLLEVGIAAGRTFVDATYPDPKFDLSEWRTPA